MLKDLDKTSKKYCMRINIKKTKSMIIGGKEDIMEIKRKGTEQVEKFRYVGNWMAKDKICPTELKTIALAKEAFTRKR